MTTALTLLSSLEVAVDRAPDLIRSDPWNSLAIRYETPFVDRLWTPIEIGGQRFRLYLHHIQPCKLGEAFWHPHPWPSIVLLLRGRYEMGVGYGVGADPPDNVLTTILAPGSIYEMVNPDAWHYVRPLDSQGAWSLMLAGETWGRKMPKYPKDPPKELNQERISTLLDDFSELL